MVDYLALYASLTLFELSENLDMKHHCAVLPQFMTWDYQVGIAGFCFRFRVSARFTTTKLFKDTLIFQA